MYTGFSTEIVEKSLHDYSQNEQNIDSDGLGYIFMIRQRIKQMWEAVPSGIKRAVVVTAGVVGFLLESIEDDEDSPASQEVFYNHETGKYDDGHDLAGIYYDDFPPDDHRHYDV